MKSHKGFTLIEVLVALTIVAVALPALLGLVITQMDSAGSVRETSYAWWVAENEMNRIKLLHQLHRQKLLPDYRLPEKETGKASNLSMQWRWEFTSKEMEDLGVDGFKRVELSVWSAETPVATQGKQPQPLVRLVSYVSDPEDQRTR